ncbi:hypothetical protein JQ596_15945 [Bradyrhizobium manausense]|uniref:hypothetical protein n=1 Tax=Bradyrhizobium TaxID=374 RepID=UPI001BADD1C7|nr:MULTISPECIES: hypothetical protein [Bradyrhizobium]MBR0827034.1 hypothetical protein [Bradyrhizobium manausense]UVO32393.1 hypothetical protein KUF59_18085 [Bradyrhizobium arachidis]
MTLSTVLIAAIPFVLSLASRTNQAIAPCAVTSVFTLLLSADFERAALAWFIGMLIAIVAIRERLRLISFWP